MKVICGYCNNDAKLVTGDVVYNRRKDLANLKFWVCDPCGARVGCHKKSYRHKLNGDEPLGTLANFELRKMRSAVHKKFDPLWKNETSRNASQIKRTQLYEKLSKHFDIEEFHTGSSNYEMCIEVLAMIKNGELK